MSLGSLFNQERPHLWASRHGNWAEVKISAKKIIKTYKPKKIAAWYSFVLEKVVLDHHRADHPQL